VAAVTLGRQVRPEIQALRALAVALVLVYHLWPSAVPGGFVGVDVFFVISGYLITAHLLREAAATGRVAPLAFWARRARRILPAALVVLLACALATLALVSRLHWEPFLAEIRASALYVENWHLAHAAVDYLAADDAPTPVRHFWSLSAEEQFYLVWPLLILAGAARGGRAIAAVLLTVTALSLAWSIWATATEPQVAYFVTPARAWEFGAGGLLALAAPTGRSHVAASWAGLLVIAAAAFAYSPATPFPGVAALVPVAGTLAVIWAAAPTAPLTWRPVQILGDTSYSVYLWHWPLIVFAPIVLARAITTPDKLAILALTLGLGWLCKVLVEDPVRHWRALTKRRAALTLGVAGTATGIVLLVAAAGTVAVREDVRQARADTQRALAQRPACFGAAARDPALTCDRRGFRQMVVPSPIEAQDSSNQRCTRVERRGTLNVCAFGARKAHAVTMVALIGDSHASHWRAALDPVAEDRRWQARSLAHTDCPLSDAVPDLSPAQSAECLRWNREVREWLRARPETTIAFVSQSVGAGVVVPAGGDAFTTQVRGYRDAWASLPRSVEHVVVLRDTPRALPLGGTLECVERALRDARDAGAACALSRDRALPSDPAVVAARGAPRVSVVDLTRFLCDARRCFAVVGGALVHRDVSHMTTVFAATLAPYLRRDLDRAGIR
jgi:peptidoglycan/LPS O-acetylase OafA/YrhL